MMLLGYPLTGALQNVTTLNEFQLGYMVAIQTHPHIGIHTHSLSLPLIPSQLQECVFQPLCELYPSCFGQLRPVITKKYQNLDSHQKQ